MFYLLDHFTPGLSMSQWPSCLFFFVMLRHKGDSSWALKPEEDYRYRFNPSYALGECI